MSLSLTGHADDTDPAARLVHECCQDAAVQIVPVYCIAAGSKHTPGAHVVFGEPLPAATSLTDIRLALHVLAETNG